MALLFRLAFRNIWRNPRRSLLTMGAMGTATLLLILTLGILDGMIWEVIAGATEMYHGHGIVTHPRYQENRRIYFTLDEKQGLKIAEENLGIVAASGRIRAFALLSHGQGRKGRTQPAELLGVDPEKEALVTRLKNQVITGQFLAGGKNQDMVVGQGLAKRLGADVGSEVVVMGQGADGSVAAELFEVVGLLDTLDLLRDSSLALVNREALQKAFALEGKIHEWALRLDQPLQAKNSLSKPLKGAEGTKATAWQDLLPELGEMLQLSGVNRLILSVIFYFAVVLVSSNTMYMALLERMREFAIMKAVGLAGWRLVVLILLEGFLMGLMAAVVGGGLGVGGSFWLKNDPIDLSGVLTPVSWVGSTVQPQIITLPHVDNIFPPIVMTMAVGVLVAILPAWRLFRFRPVEVLREI